jgi:hypothetical protein
MKYILIVILIGGLTLTASSCNASPDTKILTPTSSFSSTSSSSRNISSINFELEGFSLPSIGVYSGIKLPNFINVDYPSRFYKSQEPTFMESLAVSMRDKNMELEDFCQKNTSDYLIIFNCQIIANKIPHAEFYFSEYNPYSDEYDFFGKYAFFKTQSILYPALFVNVALDRPEGDLSNRKTIEQYLLNHVSALEASEELEHFTEFIRELDVRALTEKEPEWLVYRDSEKGFEINYPNGLSVRSFNGSNVFAIGPDGEFSIDYFSSNKDLDIWIDSIWSHRENRTIEREPTQVGIYDGEKVTIKIHTQYGGIDTNKKYVISSKKGFYVLSYDENYYKGINDMLNSFRILE